LYEAHILADQRRTLWTFGTKPPAVARTGIKGRKMQRKLPTLDAIAAVKAVRPIALSADGWDQFAIEVLDACAAPG